MSKRLILPRKIFTDLNNAVESGGNALRCAATKPVETARSCMLKRSIPVTKGSLNQRSRKGALKQPAQWSQASHCGAWHIIGLTITESLYP